MSNMDVNEVTINGVVYVRKDSIKQESQIVTGNRAVVVMDRGWIMAGDVKYDNGRVYLTRTVHVRRWDAVGFDGMIKDPTSPKVKPYLFPLPPVDLPATTELFKVPVNGNWGL